MEMGSAEPRPRALSLRQRPSEVVDHLVPHLREALGERVGHGLLDLVADGVEIHLRRHMTVRVQDSCQYVGIHAVQVFNDALEFPALSSLSRSYLASHLAGPALPVIPNRLSSLDTPCGAA